MTVSEEVIHVNPMFLSSTQRDHSMVSQWDTMLYTKPNDNGTQNNDESHTYITLPPFGNNSLLVSITHSVTKCCYSIKYPSTNKKK